MDASNLRLFLIFSLSACLFFSSCTPEDEKLPEIRIIQVNYNLGKASCSVVVLTQGRSAIESKGIVWGLHPEPTIDNCSHTDDGAGDELFTGIMTDLEYGETYYVRAYAENKAGIRYGNEMSFVASTDSVSNPCSVTTNLFSYPGGDIPLYNFSVSGTNISSNGSSMSIDFDFPQPPQTGKYIAVSSQPEESDECYVRGAFTYSGGFKPYPGDTVYVNKFADDKFSVTFCNIRFYLYDVGSSFYADCNVTKE